MKRIALWALASVLGIVLIGCASNRHALPVAAAYSYVRFSTQQDVLARSIDEAVAKLDFKELNDLYKTTKKMPSAHCTLNGVLPPSRGEALDYIQTSVEARLSRYNVLVLSDPGDAYKADYRCVVQVAACGGTIQEIRQKVSGGRVVANIFLQFPTLFTSWAFLSVYELERYFNATTRLIVQMIPRRPGMAYYTYAAEATVQAKIEGGDATHFASVETQGPVAAKPDRYRANARANARTRNEDSSEFYYQPASTERPEPDATGAAGK